MRAAAGMLSAVMLLSPGCGGEGDGTAPGREAAVRRAAYRSLVARDFLASCPGGARAEGLSQSRRYEELKRLALRKGAGHAVWLGENDHGVAVRHGEREPCRGGEEGYREALAQYLGTLDALAGRIAEYRE